MKQPTTSINEQITLWNQQSALDAGGQHFKTIGIHIELEAGAVRKLPAYVQTERYQQVMVVYDTNTYEAVGRQIIDLLQSIEVGITELELRENKLGDVIADEATIVQLLLAVTPEIDAIIAVGSGTIHDVVRIVSYKMDKPFLSVPTAASVDGFTSAGAPLIVNGTKETFQAKAPQAIFADINVLMNAPQTLTAAGFGDMLGKCTSLADWKVSRDLGNEPYNQLVYDITEEALNQCIEKVDLIASGSAEGIYTVMHSLLASGIAMLIADHSRSASGGEHHISHRWEMELIKGGHRQILHGAKVGVASALLADHYRQLAVNHPEVKAFAAYKHIPTSAQMKQWLSAAGGPSEYEQLEMPAEWLELALHSAHTLRNRYTGLKYMNEHQLI